MNETITDLEIFLRVVDSGGFRNAAKALGTSSATVSRRIAKLEADVGVLLMSRTTRQLFLTDAGARLAEDARGPMAQLQRALDATQDHASDLAGTVRIAATYTVAETAILPILPGLRADHPELRIELDLDEGLVDLRARAVDLAIRVGTLSDPTMIARKIVTDKVSYYRPAGPDTPYPIVSYGDPEFEPEPPALRVRDMRILKRLVRSGYGAAWLPDSICEEDRRAGRIVRDATKPVFSFDAFLVRHPNRQLPRRVRVVADRLVARGKEMSSSNPNG